MDKQELLEKASHLRIEKQSFINDTFLWAQLARDAVDKLPDSSFRIQVPSTKTRGEVKTLTRNNAAASKERIIKKDIYNSAFVYLVAAVEDYLSKIMTLVLLYDSKRIKCTIPGVSFTQQVSVVDLVDMDKDEILIDIINQRVQSLFYASPAKQLEYFDKALNLQLNDEIWGKWVEIKARRDLWIHNAGVVNQTYITKAGDYKLCELGEEAIIGNDYFCCSISYLKSMIGYIDVGIRNQYKN